MTTDRLSRWYTVLPFWCSFALIPLSWFGAVQGGLAILLMPLATWYLFAALDHLFGLAKENADPQTDDAHLGGYILLTQLWVPVQVLHLLAMLWYVPQAEHLSGLEKFGVFFGVGILNGTIGINYSHELMHQKNRLERQLADILLACVLYSHFRSEHLLVHHRYIGTPKDPVTARYNESFFRFYPRVLKQCLVSAFQAEKAQLARKQLPWTSLRNPFFKYWALQAGFLVMAHLLGGWSGLILFLMQAGIAIWQLELVNYVEHYGLTRKHMGEGKYEHVLPQHSWNAAHKTSNWLLINLQRHSDHHYKPDRRFPLLQNHDENSAPQLPHGYPVMTIAAMIPPLWRRIMNPRVKDWRAKYYPEITDWLPYNKGANPMPR